MARGPPPLEDARRRAVARARDQALGVGLVLFLVVGWLRGAPGSPHVVPLPATVDLAIHPAWRLELIPGIGRLRAAAIVADRLLHGPVSRIADLERIEGIGRGTVARMARARGVRIVIAGRPAPP